MTCHNSGRSDRKELSTPDNAETFGHRGGRPRGINITLNSTLITGLLFPADSLRRIRLKLFLPPTVLLPRCPLSLLGELLIHRERLGVSRQTIRLDLEGLPTIGNPSRPKGAAESLTDPAWPMSKVLGPPASKRP